MLYNRLWKSPYVDNVFRPYMCSLTNICYFAVKFAEAGIAKVTEYLDHIIPHGHEKPNIRIL